MKKALFQVQFKTTNKWCLILYSLFLKKILQKLNISFSLIKLPRKKFILTLLKSPHVNKKAREQFIFQSYKQTLTIFNNVSLNILKLLIINKPLEIKMKLKKIA